MKLTIVVPVYLSDPLHQEFTQSTLDSIHTSHDIKIVIINNHCHPPFKPFLDELSKRPNYHLLHNTSNNLSKAWNLGINHALDDKHLRGGTKGSSPDGDSPYILIINNDLIFHPRCIDNLILFADSHPEFILWSASEWPDMRTLSQAKWDQSFSEHPHFSCFMLNQNTIDTVGLFDENIDLGYFEDNDYHTRILLAGSKAAATATAKFYHFGSRTIHVDDDLRKLSKYHYQQNRLYFEKKWGIDPHGKFYDPPEFVLPEIFKTPFNNPQMSLKDW